MFYDISAPISATFYSIWCAIMARKPHHSKNWGGARPNSGRPLAARSKLAKQLIERAYQGGLHPFDYILSIVRDETVDQKTRLYAAHAAMPYCGAKLNTVELNVNSDLETLTLAEKLAKVSQLRAGILEQRPDLQLPAIEGEVIESASE